VLLKGLERGLLRIQAARETQAGHAFKADTPWQALGFVKQDVDSSVHTAISFFKGWSSPLQSHEDVVPWKGQVDQWVFNLHMVVPNTFALGALGYTIEHPVLHDWREAGRQLVTADLYYYFDPWWEKVHWYEHSLTEVSVKVVNREQVRAKLKWISNYREALPIAVSLGDWTSADRLLEWPGPDLKDDEGYDERTAEDNAYQVWLAMRLRGESGAEVDARRDLIARRSRQRPKLLALAADALLDGESDQLAKTLAEYLKFYQKREIDLRRDPGRRLVRQGICLDGTVLWHLARRRGLGEIKLPEELMIMIARP